MTPSRTKGSAQETDQPLAYIGIGASAGGLDACKTLLTKLSAEAGFAVIVVVHLDPNHESVMAKLLTKDSLMPVEQATDGKQLEPNRVYVVPPRMNLYLEDGSICLKAFQEGDRHKPIDRFFRSLAKLGEKAIGVILTGTGSDGTLGLQAIKDGGGLTLVQDPKTAAYDEMPKSAISEVAVDGSLSLTELPSFILDYVQRVEQSKDWDLSEGEDVESALFKICQVLRKELKYDFSQYKKSTLLRRIHRRVLVSGLSTLAEYVALLEKDGAEAQMLFRELLISVTSFFRDPLSFAALKPVIGRQIQEKMVDHFRVWVPACASGEEVYSLAMVLAEEFEAAGKPFRVKILATDLDSEALNKARKGLYPEGIADDISPERLRRFFFHRGDGYQVNKELRDVCLFSEHNLVNDTPFARIDLISCRNLLIYFNSQLQKQIIELLHYSLNTGGHLFLGSSENLVGKQKLFHEVDAKHRIYRSLRSRKRPQVYPIFNEAFPGAPKKAGAGEREVNSTLARFVLPSLDITVLFINSSDQLIDSCGHPDRYLSVRPGPVDDNLFALVNKKLSAALRTTIRQVRKSREKMTFSESAWFPEEPTKTLEVGVYPYPADDKSDGDLIVVFQKSNTSEHSEHSSALQLTSDALVAQLENELQSTRQDLRIISDDLEAHNEELHSTNEELLSMNEELQSSNQELAVSKEEIQCVNQELQVVNTELEHSIAERDRVHSDLLNLFSSNPNPTIFLDRDLKIRKFTPSSIEVFRLLPSDCGRPLQDITSRLNEFELEEKCVEVLRTLVPFKTTFERPEEQGPPSVFRLRISPYLSVDDTIDGVVLSYNDVSELQLARIESEKREQQATAVARLSDLIYDNEDLEALCGVAIDEILRLLNVEVAALYRYQAEEERLHVLYARGSEANERALLIGTSVVRYVRLTGQSVCFSDLSSDDRFDPSVLQGEIDLHSGVVTPIPKAKHFLGVLGAYDKSDREFTNDEVDFVETVAYILGTALNRSEDRFLNALNSAVASTLEASSGLQEAMEGVRETLVQELHASVCEVWLSRPESTDLYLATSPDKAGADAGVEGLVEAVWAGGEPIWITDISLQQEFSLGPQSGDSELMGGFAFLLQGGEERLGVVSCYFSHKIYSSDRTLGGLKGAGFSLGEFVRRTRAEARLKRSEKRLHQALKAVPFPLCILSATGDLVLVSDALYALTGYQPSQLQTVEDFAKIALRDSKHTGNILALVKETANGSEIHHHGTSPVWTAQGEEMLWDITTAPLGHSLQGTQTLVAVAYDVTEQERVRRELVESGRYKDEFLAMLGHELRNPLAGIRSGLQLMVVAESEEDIEEALGVIDRQSSQMVFLIDGLLDMNRIARGKVSLSPTPINLTKLTALAVRDKLHSFRDEGLTLSFKPSSTPVWVQGDRTRLLQVIDNLVSNSLKFTDQPGAVEVSLTLRDEKVQMRVKDSGQGLSPELAAVIFEPFRQGTQSLSRPTGGLGLGLSLVKLIVELHGGTVSVHSEGPGKGSEFLVTLPTCEAQTESEADGSPARTEGPWGFLYVEDNLDLGKSLSRILQGAGHQVRHAVDGETALRLIEECVPDIILCDVGLPGEWDGYSLARKFQENPALCGVPLVAVTGYGLAEDRKRSKSAGFWKHLTKPVELSHIENLLQGFAHPHNEEPKVPREGFYKVLVVDDNRIVAQGTARMLVKAGFEVQYAFNAPEALRTAQQQVPHIALLDLGLSDKGGGIALKQALSTLPGLEHCLYFAITGSDLPEDRERTKASGFSAHLVKPVSLEKLLHEFKRVVAGAPYLIASP